MIDETVHNELRKKYNPDGSELRNFQLQLLDNLKYFNAICKENGIRYWLSSGTCLGAIRHGGFIPWDDDIDVEMLREDYLRFEKVFKGDKNFVLQTYKNDLYYTQPFPKLRSRNVIVEEGRGVVDQNYRYKGLFLDVFIMESSPRVIASFCHFLVGTMRHLGYKIKKRNRATDAIFWLMKKLVYGLIAVSRLFCCFGDKSILRHTLGTGLERKTRKKEYIFPLTNAQFEGMEVPVPGNYHGYLQRMFGDYMRIPDLDTIHTHHLRLKNTENEGER